ncbi:hypothetical protein DH2020_038705 [Rehmannia glutinosa]|uniref:4-coumarate--CoA ligase n=1 Tax=Rehmannia glutinosa TaxID=99300 RepID=A0ABR0UY22_REHGL
MDTPDVPRQRVELRLSLAAVGGASVCLRRVDAPSIYEAIEKYKVTHMCGAPVVLNMLTNHPGCRPLENPVHIMTAGAPPPAAVLGRAESLGFIVSHGYGLTETGGPVVTCAWKKEWDNLSLTERAKLKSRQGVTTIAFSAYDVVDPDLDSSVPRDGLTMGEIVLRGGSLMLGYLKDPEGTAKSMRNGWFYTGDVGVVHPDGYLEVKDRSKDVIICGGENLSSVEVEAVLYSHPAVNEAAVVARPSRFWGEMPCAFVSLKAEVAEKPSEKEIREYCKARLPLYMVPRTVVFKEELPKTSTGKIQKQYSVKDLIQAMEQLKPSPPNSSPLTPIGFLERAATVYADGTSIIYNSTTYTWSETYHRCLKMASSISSLGVRRYDVVSVVAPNIPAMYELHFAVPMAGAVLNTINLRLDARTISVVLRHAQPKLVFVDYQSESVIREAISYFPTNFERPLLVLIGEDGELGFSSSEGDFHGNYEGMILNGDSNFDWVRPVSEFDPLTLNYTSGTTSAPKGVVHSHRGTFIVSMDSLIEWSVPKEAVYLWTLPMFHANGWSYTWGMAAAGATNVCLRKFDSAAIYAAIRKYNVTHMCGAPVVLNMLSNVPDGNPRKTGLHPHRRGSAARGGSVQNRVARIRSQSRKWNKFPAAEKARLKSRQGVRTPAMAEVDVIDPETGESVKKDGKTLGEIVLRGGCIMLGYLKDPEGTSKSMKNGWFYTGDVGVMHPDGYLEIKDRSKDVIISGGENLSSVEVESVLYTHPAVNEAAVVARPDEFWGETPCAFLSLKDGVKEKPTEKEVMEFCRTKLPRYMVPKTVVFKAELPKTSTGKIQKFVLRETAKAMGPSKMSRL